MEAFPVRMIAKSFIGQIFGRNCVNNCNAPGKHAQYQIMLLKRLFFPLKEMVCFLLDAVLEIRLRA